MKKPANDTLIAIINKPVAFRIVKEQLWYHVPIGTAPIIVKNGELKYLSFFHTKRFKELKYSIAYYGKVKKITQVKRWFLFPNEITNKKTNKSYYKIELEALEELPKKLVSEIPRRWLFVPTTLYKLLLAESINDVFNGSFLEERLWQAFQQHSIKAEREFTIKVDEYKIREYRLDFAIFCKNGKINIECDGHKYHDTKKAIVYDKNRNNVLSSKGWTVLRFTTDKIKNDLEQTIDMVKETINQYGGIELKDGSAKPMDLDKGDSQLKLF